MDQLNEFRPRRRSKQLHPAIGAAIFFIMIVLVCGLLGGVK